MGGGELPRLGWLRNVAVEVFIPAITLGELSRRLQHHPTLVTRDQHFRGIPDLTLESWS